MVSPMGWMTDALRRGDPTQLAPEPELEAAHAPRQVGPASWASEPNHLQSVVWSDLLGADGPLTRELAMSIPALARQRHILAGTLARCPLRAIDGAADTPLPTQPRWMHRTDGTVHPYFRSLWTADDVLFHGWAVWTTERDDDGQLETADRLHPDHWEIDEVGRVIVDDEVAKADEVLAIPGPHEGILNFGPAALRRVIDNLDAAANAARNPSAYLELHYTGDATLTDPEIDAHIQRWADARRGLNGGVSFTNKWLEVKEHGTHEAHLLIEGRNADAVDVSRMVSSPSAMTDATSAGASLTYETTEGRNTQMIDYGVGFYMDAIAARLSMDDVVPAGVRTAFDTGNMTVAQPSPTGAQTDD